MSLELATDEEMLALLEERSAASITKARAMLSKLNAAIARAESVDSGGPRIIYNSARTVRVLALGSRGVAMLGFRAGGHWSKAAGPVRTLAQPITTPYDYDACREGFGAPALTALEPEMWIAVFAHAPAGRTEATIRMVPFLEVTAWDANTRTAAINDTIGAMATAGEWAGVDLLACHESGVFSWRTSTIASNTASSVTLAASAASWGLAAGDYLLPAPAGGGDYRYLGALKMDYASPGVYEWRNFAMSGGGKRTSSTTGDPFENITSLTDVALDMRGYVSPLATGWTAAIHAYGIDVDAASGAAFYVSHDQGSLHAVARVAADRVPSAGFGVSSMASAIFGAKQEVYGRVVNANSVGEVDILGWSEE